MTINLHGKEYVEVKDRVAAAHTEDSYSMLKEETFGMNGREYVRVYIEVKGKQYIGTAECKFNAAPKSPDGQSPFECGETSALGRALGFAGYGVVDSIASADEVVSNVQQERARKPAPPLRNGDGSPVVVPAQPAHTLKDVKEFFLKYFKPGQWRGFKSAEVGPVEDEALTDDELDILYKRLLVIDEDQKRRAGAQVAGAN